MEAIIYFELYKRTEKKVEKSYFPWERYKMKVTKDSIIGEVLDCDRETAIYFFEIGMHCLGCPSSRGETVEEACAVHGIECEPFLAQLNHFLEAYELSEAAKEE